jgi:hypothetical protein
LRETRRGARQHQPRCHADATPQVQHHLYLAPGYRTVDVDSERRRRDERQMLSNFQITTSVCAPERLTLVFAASEKASPVVEHDETSALHVAAATKALLLSVLLLRVAFTHALGPLAGALHETSLADHVVAPLTGGVNDGAFAISETFS